MGASQSSSTGRRRASTGGCASLSRLLRCLVLCQPERASRLPPRQKRPLVQRRPKKRGAARRKEAMIHAAPSERVALTASTHHTAAADSDADSLTAPSGPSIKVALESQRKAAADARVAGKQANPVAEEGLLPVSEVEDPPRDAARLIDVNFVSIVGPDDGALSDGVRTCEAGNLIEEDPFGGCALPPLTSFPVVGSELQSTPSLLQQQPGAPVPIDVSGAPDASHWERQMQVASGLGKYHAAMAAAREQVNAATRDVGRVGPATGRKFRRCVYDTELE